MSRFRPEIHRLPRPGGTPRAPRGLRGVVVGGGIAGIAASTVLCERGVAVTLLEKESTLGGRAGGFTTRLATGHDVMMERGFHAFFRHYYNLRALLRRIDPTLACLQPLDDYPILGPGGLVQGFSGLHLRPPFHVIELAWKTPHLRAADLSRMSVRAALEMMRFDGERTYAQFDAMCASSYITSLGLPPLARRMLFDVFSHSFFNPESDMSAAELLMMFHFYMMGNPEGLVFDVATRPMPTALWEPFRNWLCDRGVRVRTEATATSVTRAGTGFRVAVGGESFDADFIVLALDVSALHSLVQASPDLAPLRPDVEALEVTRRFAVWRVWLDRPLRPERAPFAGTTGIGWLDNISIYDRFQDESAAWAKASGGSVVELHAYAIPPDVDEAALKANLWNAFGTFYPEGRTTRVLDERFLVRQDCPSFAAGMHVRRPRVASMMPNLAFAGDAMAMPFPCALMERAAASGFLAANTLLAPLGVAPEPLRSVPTQGVLSAPRSSLWSRRPRSTFESVV